MTTPGSPIRDIAWIAGVSAQAGLGAALARSFARAGLLAVVTGRSLPRLEAVAAQIRESGGCALALAGDVTQEAEMRVIREKIQELGTLTAAVFNAASGEPAPSLDLSVEAFERTWRTTTLGGFIFGKEAVRALLPQARGTVLFTGATASLRGRPPFAAFAAAKAGLRSISQTLAREFGPKGIHVAHIVIDGGIDGERLRTSNPGFVKEAGADGLLSAEAIADVYWHVHTQHPSAWTQELDLRPYKEKF